MKRKFVPLILVLAILSVGGGCTGKHPADSMAPYIMTGTDVYQGIEQTLVTLNEAGNPLVTENWQKISNVRWKASAAFRRVWKAWYELSRINNPQNQEEMNEAFSALAALLGELLAFIPATDPNFNELKVQVDSLKAVTQ